MVRPVAVNSTRWAESSPRAEVSPVTVTFMDVPLASVIWEATVRFQMRS